MVKYIAKQAAMVLLLSLVAVSQAYAAGLEESVGYSDISEWLPSSADYQQADEEAYAHYMESRESLEDMGATVYYLGNDAEIDYLSSGWSRAKVTYYWGWY